MFPISPIIKLHYTYYFEQLESEASSRQPEKCHERIKRLNKFLEKENFKYKMLINDQKRIKLYKKHDQKKDNIDYKLSDGEKIQMSQLIWKFEDYPPVNEEIVFLLDEPDCHLHPGAVKQLIEAIQNLSSKMKIQIIMTTQNPITLNYVYDDSLYVMNYTDETETKISIVKASDSKIHPSTLLTNDLVAIHKKFYQIYVPSETDKHFFEMLNEQHNLHKHVPIIFRAINREKKLPTGDNKLSEDSRYKILNLFDSIRVDNCLKKEINYIRELLTNRLEIFKDSSESKIIDMMEIVDGNDQLDFIFGLLDRRTSIIKNGRKKRIIYLDRFDIGCYILDPFHIYLVLNKLMPECELVHRVPPKPSSEAVDVDWKEWHQKLLNETTNAIKEEIHPNSIKEFDFTTKSVAFSKPKMQLEYQNFLIETDSMVLLDLIKKAFLAKSEIDPPKSENLFDPK